MSSKLFIITVSSLILLILGIFYGIFLGFFEKLFRVNKDIKIERITEALPGLNCGACGFAGCSSYAEVISLGKAPINLCNLGGSESIMKIADILGLKADNLSMIEKKAVVLCQGGNNEAVKKGKLEGISSCRMAHNLKFSEKLCSYSCLGYGDCVLVCPFDAIKMNKNGLPSIDNSLCTGCGICVKECPRDIIDLFDAKDLVLGLCKNSTRGPSVSKICSKGCITCCLCEKKCPQGAIKIENNLPFINIDKCDLCGICVDVCPTKTLCLIKLDDKNEKKV